MFCSKCGKQLPEGVAYCPYCGMSTSDSPSPSPPPPPPPVVTTEDSTLKYFIPIGRSGYAIAAGYLGLFAVTLIFAPLALIFGLLALSDIAKHPEKCGKGRAWFGIIMGAIFSILGIVALVA